MGRDREARALAACEYVNAPAKEGRKIIEKQYQLRPVVAQHLADLERKALSVHKRNHLQTFKDNADLLPEGEANKVLREEFQKVASWELVDLPQKKAYNCNEVSVNQKVLEWVDSSYGEVPKLKEKEDSDDKGMTKPERDAFVRNLLTTALDNEEITLEQVQEMTGKRPVMGWVRFDQWWVTSTVQGMINYVYSSLRKDHPEITYEDVENWPLTCLIDAARKVENITTVSSPNG